MFTLCSYQPARPYASRSVAICPAHPQSANVAFAAKKAYLSVEARPSGANRQACASVSRKGRQAPQHKASSEIMARSPKTKTDAIRTADKLFDTFGDKVISVRGARRHSLLTRDRPAH